MEEKSDYFDFELKPQQQKAFEELKRFTYDMSTKVFILSGYAGTGKTTLMSGFVKWLKDKNKIYSLLASTGRAAKILSDRTNEKAKTIHSLIYSFSELNDDIESIIRNQNNIKVDDKGQLKLIFTLSIIDSSEEIFYIVDESSMISDNLNIAESFAKFGTGELIKDLFQYDKNGKFIFIGDLCQLPPVGQLFSPALSKEYISNKYKFKTNSFELTEVLRQANNNGIITSSLQLRTLIKSNPEVKFAKFPFKGKPNITIHSAQIALINSYIECIKNYGYDYSTLICHSNKNCTELNKIIRLSLGRGSKTVENGDILLVTQNNYLADIVNGDIIKVLQTGKREYRCGLTFLNIELQELASKEVSNLMLIEDILYSHSTNINEKQHKDLMIDFYNRMKDKGINQKDPRFKLKMFTDPYLNALRAVYGYALTCHKSQGGEWNEVFLYLDNKIHGIPKPSIYQWMYTAITRAKEKLHVSNDWYIN